MLATKATPPVSSCEAKSWTYGSRSCPPTQAAAPGRRRRSAATSTAGRSAWSSLILVLLLGRGGRGRVRPGRAAVDRLDRDDLLGRDAVHGREGDLLRRA